MDRPQKAQSTLLEMRTTGMMLDLTCIQNLVCAP